MKRIFTFVLLIFILKLNSQVLINQIYGGGGNIGATWNTDVIQLINIGSTSIDLSGYAIQYASAAGSSWNVDPIPTGTTIEPGAILNILLTSGSNGSNPPAPSIQATAAPGGQINLSGTAGKVALTNNTTALTGSGCPTGAVDYVGYGGTASCGPHTTATITEPPDADTQGYWRTNTSVPGSFDVTTTPLSSNFPLPIEIIKLDIYKHKNIVKISFSTSSEINSSHFIIEWSRDANEWNEIGTVKAGGTTHDIKEYTFIHENPKAGINYYRLTQVDFDGRKETFPVKSVYFGSNQRNFDIIPNLAFNNVKIEFEKPVENGRLHIYNIDGQLMQSYVLASGIDVLRIDVSELPTGQYIAKYIDGEDTINRKFIKQ